MRTLTAVQSEAAREDRLIAGRAATHGARFKFSHDN